ncbi:oxysterol-binding protein 1-like isoform X2 [Hydractinia symbiolongicarpus]|uniref:oxysterol-binding protein 1-like isoform X2 n=1 Tax=Hydractinia symbiolongicarpus TaxID=13093 RepID=UPI00254B6FE4|nr:oxysterol-binding protein 1-like isoform X2 [Hydractinia symbiolongicarpus]
MPDGRVCPDQFRGHLWKWTNYIKGYQKRWFVLSNGLLSYYRSPAEMNHTCRGTINLAGAYIDTVDSCSFVTNGGSQVWHLRAGSEVERQRWVTALELAKVKAIKSLASDDDSDSDSEDEITIKMISTKLDDLNTCHNLVNNHGGALQKAIGDLVDKDPSRAATPLEKTQKDIKDVAAQNMRLVNEKAQLFRITSNAMINACADFLELAQSYERKFSRLLNTERGKRMRLEETVETLAKQHIQLERACEIEKVKEKQKSSTTVESPTIKTFEMAEHDTVENENESDDDLFEDAMSDFPEAFPGHTSPEKEQLNIYRDFEESTSLNDDSSVASGEISMQCLNENTTANFDIKRSNSEQVLTQQKDSGHRRWLSEDVTGGTFGALIQREDIPVDKPYKHHRRHIPNRPNANLNLWSIMKNCIGKELTKIPMPVNFNEPLSMTQRLTEELEYSDLLDRAACCENSLEQICYIAAFSISCYASTAIRTGKPFNPLLGETYECDRSADMGWTSLAEQVSHHPPSVAHHVEGRGWTLWQNFTMSSKFRGKYLLVSPLGTAHCKFAKSGNHYTWKKVTTSVNNIIVGKLWIDQSGEMDIRNHTTGEKCHLKYHAYSYFSRDAAKKVTGFVADVNNVTRYVLSGIWDQKVECGKVIYKEPHLGGSKAPQGMPTSKSGNPQTLPAQLLWSKKALLAGAKQMYYFSEFTCSLNEMEPDVCPTDSRLRPDIRKMEEQNFDEANRVKLQLEEKQRGVRRAREQEAQMAVEAGRVYAGYKPTWFEYTEDEHSDLGIYVYKGGYWEAKEKQDWGNCPDIYLQPP